MAKKQVYKIPTSLDMSFLDREIPLRTNNGITLTGKPISMKTIFVALLGLFIWLYVIFATWMSSASILVKVLFTLFWVILVYNIGGTDRTKKMGLFRIPTSFNYMIAPKKITTRSFDQLTELQRLLGIKDVDSDGLIYYTSGGVGMMYEVVGSASVLLFEQDMNEIVNRVDRFYRGLQPETVLHFDTVKQSQRVDEQLYNLDRRHKLLQSDSPGLDRLFKQQAHVLRHEVGGNFKSIHQILTVEATSLETLNSFNQQLSTEVQSGLMFKQAIRLDSDVAVAQYLRTIYGGLDD